MVTVKEVAREAGVSPATVSRVINGASNVSPDIRQRVQDTIRTLGYFPNNAARSLVKRQAGAIAVLMRNLHSPFYTELIHGFEEAAGHSQRNIIFCSLGREQEYRDRYIQFLTNGISDAIILYGTLFTDRPIIEHLSSVRFPFLLIENNFDNMPVNQLLINNLKGACQAMEHLVGHGHRRIAHFLGDPNKKVNLERFNGYTSVMQKHGLPIAQDDIISVHTNINQAYDAARALMQRPAQSRPTAIFASNDRIAARAIEGIHSLGYSVPVDMSVVGFDNQKIYEGGYSGPAITSVRQPLREIGCDSIEILTSILEGGQDCPFTKVYEATLVEQETVCSPPKLIG